MMKKGVNQGKYVRLGCQKSGDDERLWCVICIVFFFFQAEDGIRDLTVTGVQTCALPIYVFDFQQWGYEQLRVPPIFEPRNYRSIYRYLRPWARRPSELRMIIAPRAGPEIGRASCRERV